MSIILRVVLIICSLLSFVLCIKKVKQCKMRVADSIIWIIGSFLLILMSVFSNAVEWISIKLGFKFYLFLLFEFCTKFNRINL